MTDDAVLTVRELGGKVCRCGAGKRRGQTFCPACFYRLPPELNRDLNREIDKGHIDAYTAAVAYLKKAPARRFAYPPR